MNTWLTNECLKEITRRSAFAARLPPVSRVRRRGFRRDVRRGDYISRRGQLWCVVKRSAWHLWVEPVAGSRLGDVVTVRVPQRFEQAGA